MERSLNPDYLKKLKKIEDEGGISEEEFESTLKVRI